MKKIILLLVLFTYLNCHGQFGVSGSVLIQNNEDDFSLSKAHVGLSERKYRAVHIPAFAVALIFAKNNGGYSRWYLTSLYRNTHHGFDIKSDNINAPATEMAPNKIKAKGGRVGFGYGINLDVFNADFKFFIEPNLSMGGQQIHKTPTSPTFFAQEYLNMNMELGTNISMHRDFKKWFVKSAIVVPAFRCSFERRELKNPSIPRQFNLYQGFSFDTVFRRIGLEIGCGYFLTR